MILARISVTMPEAGSPPSGQRLTSSTAKTPSAGTMPGAKLETRAGGAEPFSGNRAQLVRTPLSTPTMVVWARFTTLIISPARRPDFSGRTLACTRSPSMARSRPRPRMKASPTPSFSESRKAKVP